MKDVEHRFLSRIWSDGPTAAVEAVEQGITAEHFADPDYGRIWTYTTDYVDQYDLLPSIDDIELETDIPWEPSEPEDALGRLVELMKDARLYGLATVALKEAKEHLRSRDPKAALTRLGQAYDEGSAEKGVLTPVNVHDDWGGWFDTFWENDDELIGIPTGFPTIDYATGGYQPEQLVTVVGPPKAGKSTLLLELARQANIRSGKRVLFCTFEMSAEEQRRRLACMMAGVDYSDFIQKRLSPKVAKEMRRTLDRFTDVMPDFHFASDITAGSTVGAVLAQVRKYDPAVVFIDGVYLMDAEVKDAESMDPKALTALTRNLKRAAQRTRKPFIISHQVLESRYSKKAGLKSKDIGYSSSFAQDSDVILGVEPPLDPDNDQERRLSIVLARNAAARSTMLSWDWTTSTFEEVDGYEEYDPDVDGDFE